MCCGNLFFPSQVAWSSSGCTDMDREAGGSGTYNVCCSKSLNKLARTYLFILALEINGAVAFPLQCGEILITPQMTVDSITKISELDIFMEFISLFIPHVTYHAFTCCIPRLRSCQCESVSVTHWHHFIFFWHGKQSRFKQTNHFTEPEIWPSLRQNIESRSCHCRETIS